VEDESGPNPVTGHQAEGKDRIVITTARPIGAGARVHGAHQTNPADYIPTDPESQLPMLSFYNVEVR
jgi:hypothetical protein